MPKPDSRDPNRLRRRDALRLLAGTTGAVVGGSLIVSQPAFADSGSTACRYDFTGSPQVEVIIRNRFNSQSDTLSMTVSGVGGSCPCGGGATIEYAYHVIIPGIGQGGTGWIPTSTVSVTNPPVLWPNSGGGVTVSVGIRVTCAAVVGEAIRCRYGSATYIVGSANYAANEILSLPNNNGNSPPPSGLPACDPALQSSAFQVLSGGSGTMIGFVPGLLPEPIDNELLDDPLEDLGVEPRTPAESDPPIGGEPPTATTAPNAAPSTSPPGTTSPPSTSAPSTTTPSSPTTSAPTTAPPASTAPAVTPPATTNVPTSTSIPLPPANP